MRGTVRNRLRPIIVVMALALLSPGGAFAGAKLHGQGLLWRVEGFGYEPSHVFGTIHLSDERILALPQPVLDAFDNSRAALFELIVPGDGFVGLPQQMLLPHGVTLEEILGRQIYAQVAAAARRYGFTTRQIGRMAPGSLLFVFDQTASEWRRRTSGWIFLDHALQQEALALGKPIYPLERVEEQAALLDNFGPRPPIGIILLVKAERALSLENDIEVLIQDYLRRDLDAMMSREEAAIGRMPQDMQRIYKEYNRRLLDVRNHIMVRRMQPFLAQGRAFVAVGAAHLPGKEGVLHLLEGMGYTVTRVY